MPSPAIISERGTGGHFTGISTASLWSANPTTPSQNGTAREVHEAANPGDLRRWLLVFTNNTDVTGTVTVSGATLAMYSNGGSAGTRTFDLRNVIAAAITSQATWTDRTTGVAWTTAGAYGTPGEVANTPAASVAFAGAVPDAQVFTSSALDSLLTTFLNAGTGAELRLLMSRDPIASGDSTYNEFAGIGDTTNGPMLTIPYTAGGGPTSYYLSDTVEM